MKMKNNLFEELNIKETKKNSFTALDIDVHNIKQNVNARIASASNERKLDFMKSKRKFAFIAVAATLVLGVTAFAASGIVKMWSGSSSSTPDYKSLPSEQQVVRDIGYKAILIESFESGYKFDNGSIVKNKMTDENGGSLEKFKSVSFKYEKDGDIVYFSQEKYNSETEKEGEIIANENGVDIYYYSYTNKLVPPGYELTDEDKKAEEKGELVFSYGSSEVEINEVQSVSWEKDGMHYLLMQIDGKLSPGELCEMAKEALSK